MFALRFSRSRVLFKRETPVNSGVFNFKRKINGKQTIIHILIFDKMNYTYAELKIPKKGNDWYVYYTYLNPETGYMEPFKVRDGINRIKDKKLKKQKGEALALATNKELESGVICHFGRPEERKIFNTDFHWWCEERLKYVKAKYGYYNHKKLKSIFKQLKRFSEILLIEQVNHKFLQDYEAYLIKKGNTANTIADKLTRIRTVYKDVVKAGAVPYYKNPFIDYKYTTTNVEKERISYEEIKKLEAVVLTNINQDQARNMYLLSFYCGGIRFGDLCRLENQWFTETHLDYRMHKSMKKKSSKKRFILLVDSAKRIVEKYRNTGKYLFETGVNWEKEEKSINARNVLFNKWLKAACGEAEITKITFHTSRNSLADYGKQSGMDVHGIKELLGLSKVATAEVYMRDHYQKENEEAMKKMFNQKTI